MGICNADYFTFLPTRQEQRAVIEGEMSGDIIWLPADWPTYWRSLWRMAADVYAGLHDYKTRSLYLIQKPGEPDDAYTYRLAASVFDNYYKDAIDFYSGLLSKFAVLEETDDRLQALFNNVDGRGNSLAVFLLMCDRLMLRNEGMLVFVDLPIQGAPIKQPRLREIDLMDIYSPIVEEMDGEQVITQIAIRRTTYQRKGEYKLEAIEQFWLYGAGWLQIFEPDSQGNYTAIGEQIPLLDAAGRRLEKVPVIWYSCGGGVPLQPQEPPFQRLLEASLLHMNKVSELNDAEGKVLTLTPRSPF